MVVTGSRKEAVRWTKQMETYIKKQGYGIGLLAAFSGEVTDDETPGGPFSEINMNPGLLGRDIRGRVQDGPVFHPFGGQQVPDRVRPAIADGDVCRPQVGRRAGCANLVATEPSHAQQGQGHHLCGGLRERAR